MGGSTVYECTNIPHWYLISWVLNFANLASQPISGGGDIFEIFQ